VKIEARKNSFGGPHDVNRASSSLSRSLNRPFSFPPRRAGVLAHNLPTSPPASESTSESSCNPIMEALTSSNLSM